MTHIYTDGACLLNTQGDLAIGLCGYFEANQEIFVIDNKLIFDTTSYAMELKAVQIALENIKSDAIIFCDSMQAIDNITTKGKIPKTDIEKQIRKLFELKNKSYNVQMQWVKSHGDNLGNNIIDKKLEQEIVKMIQLLPSKNRDGIIDRVRARYELKGVFESFSDEFFVSLIHSK